MARLLLECPTMTTRPLTTSNAGGAMVALAGVTALAGLWRWGQLLQYMRIGEALADHAVPFERKTMPHAPAVLVVGDSTGVGHRRDDARAIRLRACSGPRSRTSPSSTAPPTAHVRST